MSVEFGFIYCVKAHARSTNRAAMRRLNWMGETWRKHTTSASTGALASLVQVGTLIYLFLIFKTRVSFHHPMEEHILSRLGAVFQHPIHSNKEQSQICPWGKKVILLLVAVLTLRAFLWRTHGKMPLAGWVWAVIWVFALTLGAVLNMNAFIYLLPAALIEVLVIH